MLSSSMRAWDTLVDVKWPENYMCQEEYSESIRVEARYGNLMMLALRTIHLGKSPFHRMTTL